MKSLRKPVGELSCRPPGEDAGTEIRRAAAGDRGRAGQADYVCGVLSTVVKADVGRRIHIAIGVIEIDPIALIGRQHRAQAHHPAVIDMIDRALIRVSPAATVAWLLLVLLCRSRSLNAPENVAQGLGLYRVCTL
jgi:hypothetical protein